jgi:2-enoate reductase
MDPETGAKAVAEGLIDGVGIARQFLVDPQWITKLIENRLEDIKPCICCHSGCFNFSSSKGHANTQDLTDTMGLARCALNPETMQSKKFYIKPCKKAKKIAIVGGGIAGMEAAILCAKRGHSVTLYEKTDKLGGVFIAASRPEFKEKDRELIAWYLRELTKYSTIEVKMNTMVEDVNKLDCDEVIIATGAKARRIPIKGVEKSVEAIDYLLDNSIVGDKVVIIGGGLTGCEIAYDLYLKGKTPVIVEAQDDLITTKGICLANTSYLRDFFKTNKVEVHLESTVAEICDGKVLIKDKDGNIVEVITDSVIMSVGYTPAPLAEKGRHIHVIGDADKVGNLRTVIWGAWQACMKL